MSEQKPDFISNMPKETRPVNMQANLAGQKINQEQIGKLKSKPWGKIIIWIIVVLVGVFLAIQYVNAAKYQALVQVINEDRIGVNPTGDALDFGDLPRNKSAIRTVDLKSSGNTASFIMVWKFGAISDLVKLDKNYFTLQPHASDKLQFSVYVPDSANYQYYKGKVIIFQIPKIWP